VNGIGERAGNAALEEIVMAFHVRQDRYAYTVGIAHKEIYPSSELLTRLSGQPVQVNKAVVGRNAFAHEAGIHQHGVLADRETYEIIDASTVGQEAVQIVLGKHSGRHAFRDTLEKMGIHVQGDALNNAFVRFKELADKKVEITEADLEAIVAEELGTGIVHRYTLAELSLAGGTAQPPTASVVLADGEGGKEAATGHGDGMIDAAIAAISEATGVRGTLTNFQVQSVTGGSDALGAVALQLEAEDRKVTGRGVATDVVEASARAYLNAVNKIVRLRGSAAREASVGP
jgi:2-isopropylmalate synthase